MITSVKLRAPNRIASWRYANCRWTVRAAWSKSTKRDKLARLANLTGAGPERICPERRLPATVPATVPIDSNARFSL